MICIYHHNCFLIFFMMIEWDNDVVSSLKTLFSQWKWNWLNSIFFVKILNENESYFYRKFFQRKWKLFLKTLKSTTDSFRRNNWWTIGSIWFKYTIRTIDWSIIRPIDHPEPRFELYSSDCSPIVSSKRIGCRFQWFQK